MLLSLFFIFQKKYQKKINLLKIKTYQQKVRLHLDVVNIGNNKPIQLLEYVKQIELKLKRKVGKNICLYKRGDIRMTLAENKKIKKLIGFTPNTSIKFGINKFVDWYLEYYNAK